MILDKVRTTIRRYKLIEKADKILIGVSGGPDSVALLYILNKLKRELAITLHIAHLDHMLRKDSYKDRLFVEELAKRLKIPITCGQLNVKGLARHRSLEEVAREVRLNFFFKVAEAIKAKKIALGHNLDDQAETVLMRILRGTGLYGLAGILPKREISGFQIIRPLIELRRKEIEAYLKRIKIKPCIDKSNLEDIYFRNKIRNKLIPLLENDYNKNIKIVLSNLAETAGYDYDYLTLRANRLIKQLKSNFNLEKLKRMHPAMRRLLFRIKIAKIQKSMRRINFQHIKEIEDLLFNRPPNSIVDLPKGIVVIKRKNNLYFRQRRLSST
ncbi:MAG: tRNA lysidine(34) synthetase TilS [Candidatus Omnitrophica bacterium]|nr:tRNA lysidine(34) synthetase TilS [Candidatus Omnitrophota bacterium]